MWKNCWCEHKKIIHGHIKFEFWVKKFGFLSYGGFGPSRGKRDWLMFETSRLMNVVMIKSVCCVCQMFALLLWGRSCGTHMHSNELQNGRRDCPGLVFDLYKQFITIDVWYERYVICYHRDNNGWLPNIFLNLLWQSHWDYKEMEVHKEDSWNGNCEETTKCMGALDIWDGGKACPYVTRTQLPIMCLLRNMVYEKSFPKASCLTMCSILFTSASPRDHVRSFVSCTVVCDVQLFSNPTVSSYLRSGIWEISKCRIWSLAVWTQLFDTRKTRNIWKGHNVDIYIESECLFWASMLTLLCEWHTVIY